MCCCQEKKSLHNTKIVIFKVLTLKGCLHCHKADVAGKALAISGHHHLTGGNRQVNYTSC